MSFTLLGHAAASILLSAAPSTPLADVFVDAAGANCTTGNGTLGNPVCSISTAIGLALPGDTIRIAPGTYVENVVIGIDLDLIGTGGASVTTIDGGALGSVVRIPAAVTVTIDGLTITNGLADGGGGIALGGNSTLTLTNSTITGNSTVSYSYGGGIGALVAGASLTIRDSLLTNNFASSEGGAINMVQGTCVISDTTITGNTAGADGGGIYFSGNGLGSPILTITDSTISGNQTTGGYGGGIEVNGGGLVMTGSTVAGNIALYEGGGVETYRGILTVSNSTFSGNSGSSGGGISIFSATTSSSLSNVTVSGNSAVADGGGVNNSSTYAIATRNTIIAGNANLGAGGVIGDDTFGPFNSLGSNLIGDGGLGFSNGVLGDIVGAPGTPVYSLLGSLQDNGGPTETMALTSASPALDAGDPLVFEAQDQRGFARPLGAGPDIGAVEGVAADARAFCFGDGSGTPCPCTNDSVFGHPGGCANSIGNGAVLELAGVGSVSADTLNLSLSSATLNSFALLVSGDNQLPQLGACIGCGIQAFDGLRCAGGNLLRHGTRATNGMGVAGNGWGTPGGPASGLLAANGFMAGQTRHFSALYLDDPAFVCMAGQNSSNGISITFQP